MGATWIAGTEAESASYLTLIVSFLLSGGFLDRKGPVGKPLASFSLFEADPKNLPTPAAPCHDYNNIW